jgi:hypothetical protein
MSHITIMTGDQPSIKKYKIVDNKCEKGQVDQAFLHDSITVDVENLVDLYDVLSLVREDSRRYVIRGRGVDSDQSDVRRLKFSEDTPDGHFWEDYTSWICLDFDKYEVPANISRTSIEAIEWLIQNELPKEFHDVAYIYQWSSSAGLEYNNEAIKDGTNVHLFFWLDRGLLNDELTTWFEPEILKGFDSSTFRTVTPIFVGSYVEKDLTIIDVIPEDEKFGIIAKSHFEVTVPNIQSRPKQVINQVVDIDLNHEILAKLKEIGSVYKRSGGWIKLKHPLEKTKGDWHIKPDSPQVVHHHVKKSMRVDKWIKEFYGLDAKFKFADNRLGYQNFENKKSDLEKLQEINKQLGAIK